MIIPIIIGIACGLFIIFDSKKRNMSAGWSLLGFLFNLIGLIIYIIARKPIVDKQITNNSEQNNNFSLSSNQHPIVPDTCPLCKNPNTKKLDFVNGVAIKFVKS